MMARGNAGDSGMTPFSYQILVALAGEELHGYGIIKDIEARNGEGSVPSTGALYLALQRLEEGGLIEESPSLPGPDDDARRRYYRLTESGREMAVAETARLADLVGVARERRLITTRALSRILPSGGSHGR
jgi:DNA-binding PadR family transcriptional regulator